MMNVRVGPSAADIQNHLYTSFLQGNTADVALRVQGSWDAIYNLHRVVLIQSGFFRSLFTAGFLESGSRPEPIVVRFDDPNITRAAFEVCVSRLYGGGPVLDISPFLVPSLSHPLTASFPFQHPVHITPPGHHPATPRFLLSLLATAVYLSIPSVASKALSSVLSTIGPYTVVKYLKFSLGRHIGHLELEPGEPEAAVGLEQVAHIIDDGSSIALSVNSSIGNLLPEDSNILKESGIDTHVSIVRGEGQEIEIEPSIHYGGISNKIGEACACWLARWGTDLLFYEERGPVPFLDDPPTVLRKRSKTGPTIRLEVSQEEKALQVPNIWSRGGLDANWVRTIIAADTFFVKGERARYAFACRVVELRRKAGILEAEEREWTQLFERGIYYANMTMEDKMQISQDISPTTKQPFVSLAILQQANWYQSILHHYIVVRPPGSMRSPLDSTSSLRGKELGIGQGTADVLANVSQDSASRLYFSIPTDSSIHIGAGGNNVTGDSDTSMDQLFASTSKLTPPPSSPTLKPIDSTATFVTSESNFFGLLPPRHHAGSILTSDSTGKSRWTPFPPYRFAVEFWDIDFLKEKSRLYSHTICYAGSLFNIYVQVVSKKGQRQLGVYLQRQSSIDPIPPASAPASATAEKNESDGDGGSRPQSGHRNTSFPPAGTPPPTSHYSPSIHPSTPRVGTPPWSAPYVPGTSPPPSPSTPTRHGKQTLPATSPPVMPPQPFRDPRPAISAYFTISCASAVGTSQTRFTSGPDVFSVSQSWGWKSSSLMLEGFGTGGVEEAGVGGTAGRSGGNPLISLRATVVLGLV